MIDNIKKLLNKSTVEEGSTDNLLYLTRCLLLFFVPHALVLGIICLLHHFTFNAACAFAVAALFVVCLVCSYRVKSFIATVSFYVLLIVYVLLFSVAFGWRSSFQLLLFAGILYLWYDITLNVRVKLLVSALVGVVICVICYMTPFGHSLLNPDGLTYRVLSYGNILYSVSCITLVALFFSTKFAETERKLYLYNRELKRISETDPLTKLPNRRFALDELHQIESNYERNGQLVSFAIGDIDFFKRVNDTYGHDAGDYVLATIAGIFKEYMEDHGFVARWGGEEFLFVFEDANGDDAYLLLDKLREKIESYSFVFNDAMIPLTITFGVEEYGPRAGIEDTISAADQKLYLGKTSGRNRVVY